MTIAFGTSGAEANGTTSFSFAYPASIAAGDLLTLYIVSKYPANPPVLPSGWTLLSSASRSAGLGASGVDSGQVIVQCMYKIADGTETGSLVVSVPSGNGGRGRMIRWTKTAPNWLVTAISGVDETPTLPWSVTSDQTEEIGVGDMIFAVSGVNGDVASGVGGHTFSATGITFGAATERGDGSNTAGDDIHAFSAHSSVTAGSGTVAISYTATLGTSATAVFPTGPTIFLRLRETTLAAATGLAEDTSETVATLAVLSAGVGIAEDTSETTGGLQAFSSGAGVAEDTSATLAQLAVLSFGAGLAESTSETTATLNVLLSTSGLAESLSEAEGVGIFVGTAFTDGLAESISEASATLFADFVETSPLVGAAAVIASFAAQYGQGPYFTAQRSSFGYWDKGKFVAGPVSSFPVVGFHHPIPRGKKLSLNVEGQHAREVKAFYSNTQLRTRTEINAPDFVIIGGESWEVGAVEDWEAFGERFCRAYVSRVKIP